MSQIKVTIDGKECLTKEGETLLNVARANDIFIPAICYLNRCSPTLACRICLVEADGKQVYACNAKAKDGMEVVTTTENIARERKAIMEVYNVNHPLECGICDQSGECELQNYTLLEDVNNQPYSIKDTHKPVQNWGHIQYDPALCIVCEKCVTVCKDMVGDSALKTVPRGSDKLDASWKDNMPKDAYAMWNKLNKSVIGAVAGDTLDCSSCGECTSVCPVGALVGTDFKWTTNAWELQKIPSTCAHCSVGCQLYYEVKHTSIENNDKRIYRVTNESHYTTLCGAGRYGYDFENRVESKDPEAFAKAVEAFKSADHINFNSQITNEEAMILQKLKEKLGVKLVNGEAFRYARFLEAYEKVAGKSLYSGDLDEVRSSNFVVSIGSAIKTDSPNSRYAFNNSLKVNKGAGIYFHPVNDPVVKGLAKNVVEVNHKPLEEGVALKWVLKNFGKELPEAISSKLENLQFSEIYFSEDFNAEIEKLLKKKDRFSLIVGEDLYSAPNWKDLAELVGLIDLYTDFSVVIVPSDTNTLGVSQICDLDESATGKAIGYNEKGNFTISALGDGDFDAPALNQQEGTFVNVDKRVVPLNVALPYNGYTLNDIANEILDSGRENTIDYTADIFKCVEFDSLPNEFSNSGEELRGYKLDRIDVEKVEASLKDEPKAMTGSLIYLANPVLQFNSFTNKAHQLNESGRVAISPEYAEKLKVKDGDTLSISTKSGSLKIKSTIDSKIGGEIALLPTFDKSIDSRKLFDGYRFAEAKISKV
jgi:NADH-quinone oxidoreductase subunit G